jgi:hypothetical protein
MKKTPNKEKEITIYYFAKIYSQMCYFCGKTCAKCTTKEYNDKWRIKNDHKIRISGYFLNFIL